MANAWDSEVQTLEEHLAAMIRELGESADPKIMHEVFEKKTGIDQMLAVMAIDHDRIMLLSRSSSRLSKGHTALIYWSKQVSLKVKQFSDEYVALQSRKMWLRLLQSRFSDKSKSKSGALEAEHLVDLAVRRQQLAHVEAGLKREQQEIEAEREQLQRNYIARSTADENWVASGSMQARLGVNLHHAKDNPSSKAMSDFMKRLSVPLRHPSERRWLKEVNNELDGKSSRLLDDCRALAVGFVHDAGESVNKKLVTQFKIGIDQITDLNKRLTVKVDALMQPPQEQARPKMVQNSKKQAKRVV